MLNRQLLIFDGDSLLKLLTAYYDGDVPLDAKLLTVGTSQFLQRWVGLMVESEQWPDGEELDNGKNGMHPLQLRYEGKRNMSWSKKDGDDIKWGIEGQDFEVPR